MNAITLSSKFQLVVPREAREQLGWQPGQKLQAMVWRGNLQLVPVVPLSESRGMLAGLPNDFVREKTDREL